ncbi:Tyrosine kinase family catalytic domain protein [Ceratobasidium sp. AG-Ba]|nr:Tyrosine kinase family catalytic domain protein [Ceratobasidium sp. AG-Ba]
MSPVGSILSSIRRKAGGKAKTETEVARTDVDGESNRAAAILRPYVSGDGVPRLTDFGNATLREYTIQFTQSSTESVKSLRWDAPELFISGFRSYEADVWALGMGSNIRAEMYPRKVISTESWTYAVAISLDGSHAAVGAKEITIWDVHTGAKRSKPLIGHRSDINSLAFSPDGRSLVSGSTDRTVRIWDAESGESKLAPLEGHTGAVSCVAFSHDGQFVVSGSGDQTIRIWDASTGKQKYERVSMGGPVRSAAISHCNNRIVCGLNDGTIKTYILDLEYLIVGRVTHALLVSSIAFSPDGTRIVSGSHDKTVCLWDGRAVKPIWDFFKGHTSGIQCVTFSPGGRYIASSSSDRTIRIWDTETGTLKHEKTDCHQSPVVAVAFTPDGCSLISGSRYSIKAWDLTALELQILPFTAADNQLESEDNITSSTTPKEIMILLGKRGCEDVTKQLDLTSCGKYPISTGGFGDIYRGKLKDGIEVAIKTLRIYADSGEQGQKHFKHAARELYVWAKCQHPNVQRLLGLALFRDQIGMISEWESNGDLPCYLSRHPTVDRSYLHELGLIHGDLKGGNVLVSKNGIPRLTDFGNAALRECTIRFTKSSTESVKSLRWAAPELFKSASSSYAADVWALGMTILETITCDVPYSEKSEHAVVFAIMIEMAVPDRPLKYIPRGSSDGDALWSLLRSCWEFEPARRPSALHVKTVMKGISAGGLGRR